MRGWGCVIGVGQSQYQMGKGRWKMRHLASRGEFVPKVLVDLARMVPVRWRNSVLGASGLTDNIGDTDFRPSGCGQVVKFRNLVDGTSFVVVSRLRPVMLSVIEGVAN